MRNERKMVLVYPHPMTTEYWEALPGRSVVTLTNVDLMVAAIRSGLEDYDREISHIVFDRAIGAEELLRFLASIPGDFYGDVLWIRADGSAFLSAISRRGNGRVLYALSEEDAQFYLDVSFNSPEPTHTALEMTAFQREMTA